MLKTFLKRLLGDRNAVLNPYDQGRTASPDDQNPFPIDTFYYREWQKGRDFAEWDAMQW